MELQKVGTNTTWNDAAECINRNSLRVATEITKLQNAAYKNKGYFKTLADLNAAHPSATAGSRAYVGSTYPYSIYLWENGQWRDSGDTGGDENLQLGDYYTKEETDALIESRYEIISQEEYDGLQAKEDKLYFCYEE